MQTLNIQDPNTRKIATTDAKNADIVQPFYQKLYNRDDAPVDTTVLDDVE